MKRGILTVAVISLCLCLGACASKFQRPESTCIEGDCENGYGKMLMIDGRLYEGQFKDGKWDGPGKLTVEQQMAYEGEFREGVYTGMAMDPSLEEPEKLRFEETDFWHRSWRQIKKWLWFD